MAAAIPWIGLGLQGIGTAAGLLGGGKGKKVEYETINDPAAQTARNQLINYLTQKMTAYDQTNPFAQGRTMQTPWSAHQGAAILPNLFLNQPYQVPQMRGFSSYGGGQGTGGGNPWANYRAMMEKKMQPQMPRTKKKVNKKSLAK